MQERPEPTETVVAPVAALAAVMPLAAATKRPSHRAALLPGMRTAELPVPDALRAPNKAHLESHSCLAGSACITTESLLHASVPRLDEQHQRVSIFSAYYHSLWAQWHRLNLDPEIIESMPPKRQGLFRGTDANDFQAVSPTAGYNRAASPLNRAL